MNYNPLKQPIKKGANQDFPSALLLLKQPIKKGANQDFPSALLLLKQRHKNYTTNW